MINEKVSFDHIKPNSSKSKYLTQKKITNYLLSHMHMLSAIIKKLNKIHGHKKYLVKFFV